MRQRRINRIVTWILVAALGSCGGDKGGTVVDVDQEIQPFVGTWDAEIFIVTSDADPSIAPDLMENGTFFLDVQPSGSYTASLSYGGLVIPPELGQISVNGAFVTLRPTNPTAPVAASSFTFLQPDFLRLIGPTSFDFNLDGTLDAAELLTELRRR
jgi:hypothetical protein